ncbi:hypothetical protein L6452_17480 [Arctium lappa]|uniref:Uncharacterized protein n=1 Tax=Arctium lappa TaxID=4217 RepID=A0ACB9C3D4_ARCLA|nr:hypothetical protein L6452_17480 [Arctium lappa]
MQIKLKEKMKELEKKVIWALDIKYESGALSSLQLLELIDSIERLGLGYRFQDKIRTALEKIESKIGNNIELGEEEEDISLHAASLRFRLYRQHGYNVSQDFLKRFKDSHGGFMGCLQTDVKGLLSLYEASYLAFEEESDLHEAKLFATEHLLKLKGQETEVLDLVDHALELPMYRRMLRLQARWYIDAYGLAKVCMLITTFDDIYDAYGSLEELKIFTDAVKRWDINIVKHMPENFRISFLALYNTINDMGSYNTSSAQGENITPILGRVAEIENGKIANAISCYMNENGVCEEVAREYIKTLIDKAWRKMIKARVDCCQESADPFIDMAINLGRISHCTYQYGDGIGTPDARAKERIFSVIIEPITIGE